MVRLIVIEGDLSYKACRFLRFRVIRHDSRACGILSTAAE